MICVFYIQPYRLTENQFVQVFFTNYKKGASDENLKFWKIFESKKGSKRNDQANEDDELVGITKKLSIR